MVARATTLRNLLRSFSRALKIFGRLFDNDGGGYKYLFRLPKRYRGFRLCFELLEDRVTPGVPSVTSISPNSGPAAGGTAVVVYGSSFTGATAVDFGGTAASFTVVSDTQIDATSPAEAAATVAVIVTNPSGSSSASIFDSFTFSASPLSWTGPTVTWTSEATPPPIITNPGSQADAEGQTVSLPITATDPSGYTLSYAEVNLPPGLTINTTTGNITGTVAYGAAADFGGSYNPTIIVSDGEGGNADVSFPWTIAATPRTPILTNPGNKTYSAGAPVSLQLDATDPDGAPLIYDAEGLPPGLNIDGSTGLISGDIDPTAASSTPYTVTVDAYDASNTATQVFNITVNAADLAPQVTNPGNQANGYGDAVSLAMTATSPSGKTLAYSAAGLPPGLTIDPATGNISGTIADSAAGSVYGVVVTASDGTLSGTASFSWSVSGVQVTNPGDQDNLDGDSVMLGITAADLGGGSLEYSASGLPPGLGIEMDTGLIGGTLSSSAAASSPYTATVTVHNSSASYTITFQWTVAALNLTDPGNQSSQEGASVSLPLTASADDGAGIDYSATGLPPGLSLNMSTGVITGTVSSGAAADSPYQVTVTAAAGSAGVSQQLVWSITPAIALANPGPQTSAVGDAVSLTAASGNLETSVSLGGLQYAETGLPGGLSINTFDGTISGTVAASDLADSPYLVTLSATAPAGFGGSAYTTSETFLWTIDSVFIPSPGDQTNFDGDTVALSAAAHYHGTGTLSYSASNLPPGLSINPSTGLISGTIAASADTDSPYVVTVTVTDGTVSATQSWNWTVSPVVTLDSIDDQTNAPGDSVSLAVTAADALNNTLSYTATGLPAGVTIDEATGNITGTVTDAAASNTPYTVTVTASDGTFNASQTFSWTVAPVSITNPGPQTSADDQAIALTLFAVDAAGNALGFTATELPPGLAINPYTGEISGTLSSTADEGSDYLTTVNATDGTNSASISWQWTIEQIAITNPGAQTAQEGSAFSLALTAVGVGTPTFSASGLPAGLTIGSSTGDITGTPAAGSAGPYTVTVAVSNGNVTSSQSFTLTVNPVIAVAAIDDQTNNEGDTVNLALSASDTNGSSLTWSATGLPTGLTINASTGTISGTVGSGDAADGPYTVTVTASGGTYSGAQTVTWAITSTNDDTPTLADPGNQADQAGDSVELFLAASDPEGYAVTFSESNLPDGLTLNTATGEITGTVADDAVSAIPYEISTTATNALGHSATQNFEWFVRPAPLAATWSGNLSATADTDTGTLTLATFTTPDLNCSARDFTATINWGNGTVDSGTISGSTGNFTVTGDHIYSGRSSAGDHAVSVAISDVTGATMTAVVTGSAAVADPTFSVSGGYSLGALVNQQETFNLAILHDSDRESSASGFSSVTVNWGDGSAVSHPTLTAPVAGNYEICAAHTYGAEGTYAVTVSATDTLGNTNSAQTSIVVADIYAGVHSSLTLGSFVGASADSTASDFTATITWGDGNTSSGTVTQTATNTYTVTGLHTYSSPPSGSVTGAYTVGVSVADAADDSISFTTSVNVVVPPVQLLANNVALTAVSTGGSSTQTLGYVVSPDGSVPASSLVATITPQGSNNSSGVTVSGSNGVFQLSAGLTYSEPGDYALGLDVSSNSGSNSVPLAAATQVAPVAPQQGQPLAVTGPPIVPNNSSATYTITNLPANANVTWQIQNAVNFYQNLPFGGNIAAINGPANAAFVTLNFAVVGYGSLILSATVNNQVLAPFQVFVANLSFMQNTNQVFSGPGGASADVFRPPVNMSLTATNVNAQNFVSSVTPGNNPNLYTVNPAVVNGAPEAAVAFTSKTWVNQQKNLAAAALTTVPVFAVIAPVNVPVALLAQLQFGFVQVTQESGQANYKNKTTRNLFVAGVQSALGLPNNSPPALDWAPGNAFNIGWPYYMAPNGAPWSPVPANAGFMNDALGQKARGYITQPLNWNDSPSVAFPTQSLPNAKGIRTPIVNGSYTVGLSLNVSAITTSQPFVYFSMYNVPWSVNLTYLGNGVKINAPKTFVQTVGPSPLNTSAFPTANMNPGAPWMVWQ